MGDKKLVNLNDRRIPIIGQQEEVNINEWVVVVSFGNRYLAKTDGENSLEVLKEYLLSCITSGEPVTFEVALDFLSPLRPVQTEPGKVSFTRDPIISMLDFVVEPVPLYARITSVYFCAEMQEMDKTTYKSFASASLTQAKAYRLARSPVNHRA